MHSGEPGRLTHEEGHGIEDIAKDQLEGEVADTKALTDPSQETVDTSNERYNCQHICPSITDQCGLHVLISEKTNRI